MTNIIYRTGTGTDIHAFKEGNHLIICGVNIPYTKSFLAHSDGDVALHALMDALLSALGLGDIGELFPDTDSKFKNANSRILLAEVYNKVRSLGWKVNNLTISILAQSPRISPYKLQMKQVLVSDLSLNFDQINISAGTTEKLGFIGREEGIMAIANVLLYKHS